MVWVHPTPACMHWYYSALKLLKSYLYATPQGTTTHTDHQVATPTNRYAKHIRQAVIII